MFRLRQVASPGAVPGYQRANKLSAKNNVVEADFSRAYALAAQSSDETATHIAQLAGGMGQLCKTQYGNDDSRIKIIVKGLEFPLNKTQG